MRKACVLLSQEEKQRKPRVWFELWSLCVWDLGGGGGGVVSSGTEHQERRIPDAVNSPLSPFHHHVPQRDISSTPASYVLLRILSQM
jgi:hypothetical protein